MEHTGDKRASIKRASIAEAKQQQEKIKKQHLVNKANQRISWMAGIIFAVIPLLACGIGLFIHSDNSGMVYKYHRYISDFFLSGSFLWVSITILVMSLLDLLLHGIKKDFYDKKRTPCIIFLILSMLIVICGVWIFLDNIVNPINSTKMTVISIISFLFFMISSGIISFVIVKEV
ncbi:hypothetical protein ACTM97_08980 [Oliverpabstia intestinalis]|uniref:hypothetical protein n=1 Tax=Oliverpabstia intestinalis TaxID=2606633 RepID=UPI003F8B3776